MVLVVGRRKQQRYGSAQAASADEDDTVPGTQLLPDDRAPLGASTEVHEELGEHDLPPGSRGRSRADRTS
jgi:hypothetical protein